MNDDINGVVILDKPAGMSSAKVVAEVKRIFGAKKCGHAGTLDPFATGVLICCLNQATRLARFFLHEEKRYEAVVRLGTCTDTQDYTGNTIGERSVPSFSNDELQRAFNRFKGLQLQQPPAFSALKHKGTPLYKLARQGNPVCKAARPVTIMHLCILQVCLPDILFEVTCSAGTYIRTLCADIGRHLGCGGHLTQLRRIISSGFNIGEAVTLIDLEKKAAHNDLHHVLMPMNQALRELPMLEVEDAVVDHIRHGRRLEAEMLPPSPVEQWDRLNDEGFIKVVDHRRRLRAIVQQTPDGLMYNYCCVFH
jgi:tRNA pseudouridine55 synthase